MKKVYMLRLSLLLIILSTALPSFAQDTLAQSSIIWTHHTPKLKVVFQLDLTPLDSLLNDNFLSVELTAIDSLMPTACK